MSSWVKVSRKLVTSAIAAKPEYLAVWMHLLLSASYKEGEILVGRQVVRLKPGQLVFGRHKFAERTGVSENVIRSALKVLENLQQITIKSESKFSIISITKWAHYQTDEPSDNQQRTSNAPATHHNKEVLEIQEVDKEHSQSAKADRVPYDEIFSAYGRILKSLPQPNKITDARRRSLRARWNEDKRFQSVDFWERYFESIRATPFLMGMRGAGIDWFINGTNFNKVIDGNYEDPQ